VNRTPTGVATLNLKQTGSRDDRETAMTHLLRPFLFIGAMAALLVGTPSRSDAQVQVSSADPASTIQGTVSLDVTISGNGFDSTAAVTFLVTGTTNTGGVTVKKVTFQSSKKLV